MAVTATPVAAMPPMGEAKRVLAALSGGVDSSVCVRLLLEQGYDVAAVVMRMSPLHQPTVDAARNAADALGVPLTILDLQAEFDTIVIENFLQEYRRGRTPNPCILCNPAIKFRHLLAEAERQGRGRIATGHYARVEQRGENAVLLRGKSEARDQSYMLYRLGQPVLRRLILPLSGLEKGEVRRIAAELGLSCADKPDSQENCFIEGRGYAAFIEERLGAMPEGDLIAPDGTVCGRHRGVTHYTVGQRKGLGVALGRPVFVRRIEPSENRVYLADRDGDAVSEAVLSGLSIVSGEPPINPFEAQVKIRSTAELSDARIEPLEGARARIVFHEPKRAVSPGQSIVIYEGDAVLGGGIVE